MVMAIHKEHFAMTPIRFIVPQRRSFDSVLLVSHFLLTHWPIFTPAQDDGNRGEAAANDALRFTRQSNSRHGAKRPTKFRHKCRSNTTIPNS